MNQCGEAVILRKAVTGPFSRVRLYVKGLSRKNIVRLYTMCYCTSRNVAPGCAGLRHSSRAQCRPLVIPNKKMMKRAFSNIVKPHSRMYVNVLRVMLFLPTARACSFRANKSLSARRNWKRPQPVPGTVERLSADEPSMTRRSAGRPPARRRRRRLFVC